jgi:CHASE3 domain sensor protein
MFSLAKTKSRGRLALLFSVPLAFSLLFFLVSQIAESTDTNLIQLQTRSSSLGNLLSLTNEVEAAERGFLLTGNEQYLRPLEHAKHFCQANYAYAVPIPKTNPPGSPRSKGWPP